MDCILYILKSGAQLEDIIRLGQTNQYYYEIVSHILNSTNTISRKEYDFLGWLYYKNNMNSIWHYTLSTRLDTECCYTMSLMDTRNLYIMIKTHNYTNFRSLFEHGLISDNVGLIVKLLKLRSNVLCYQHFMTKNVSERMLKAVIKIIPNNILNSVNETIMMSNNLIAMKCVIERFKLDFGIKLLKLVQSEEMFLLIRDKTSLTSLMCLLRGTNIIMKSRDRINLLNMILKHIDVKIIRKIPPPYYICDELKPEIIDYLCGVFGNVSRNDLMNTPMIKYVHGFKLGDYKWSHRYNELFCIDDYHGYN